MDDPGPSTRRYNYAQRHIDADPPFAPYLHNVNTTMSHSQLSLPSTASIPSAGSTIRTEHLYSLTNRNGKSDEEPWLLLMMTSRSPRSEYLPMFIGKDTIAGKVELELTKPENIREVLVMVCVVFSLHSTYLQPSHNYVAQGRNNTSNRGTSYFSRNITLSDKTALRQAHGQSFPFLQFRSSR